MTAPKIGPPTAQEHLRQAMHGSINYANRAPLALNGCCCETAHEIKPMPAWKMVVVCVALSALAGIVATVAFAAERPGHQWVIWNETTDTQFHPHRFTSPTACNTDIGGQAKTAPDGTRLSCRRIDQRKDQ